MPDADALVEFLKRAFAAVERSRVGKGSPAEIVVGDSIVIVSASGVRPALPAFLYLYVPDTDAAYREALKAGAKSLEAPADMHYGDRRAMIEDPQGNTWQIATHVEDVSPEEIAAPSRSGYDRARARKLAAVSAKGSGTRAVAELLTDWT